MTPDTTWYYVAGLGVIGWGLLVVAAATQVPGKATQWWQWACGVLGALACLGAGAYLRESGPGAWIAATIADFPWLIFGVFIVVLVGAIKLLAASVPDKWHGEAITTGLAGFAVLLPILVGFVPGTAGDRIQEATNDVSGGVVARTAGWFG